MSKPIVTPPSGESLSDQLSRVRLMTTGDETWDLSDNDLAALGAVLATRQALIAFVRRVAFDVIGESDASHAEVFDAITFEARELLSAVDVK